MTGTLRELRIERVLDAPRAAIWRCWTEPALMLHWFTPKPWKTVSAEVDLRPGGASMVMMESPEGEKFPNPGQYLVVEPNVRLIFTDAFIGDWVPSGKAFMTGEIHLADLPGGKTQYTAIARHWTDEDLKAHEQMGFHPGWNAAADQLEALARTL